jgi:hypothetical protein
MDHKWLLFCPQLPSNPSSPRVTVWRHMHSAGAIGLDNGIWLLPNTDTAITVIEKMKEYVAGQGGTSNIFKSVEFDKETEEGILKRFREARAEEYAEFKEQCADFLAGIEKEIKRRNFSFAEFEENEQDMEKLESWLAKLKGRDFFGGTSANEAEAWLEKCQLVFAEFTAEVYAHEDTDHNSKMRFDPGPVEGRKEKRTKKDELLVTKE